MTTIVNFYGDWKQAKSRTNKIATQFKDFVIARILRREAEYLRSVIVKGITSQSPGGKPFKPLSQWTLAMRRFHGFSGTKALIHTGELRKSIIAKVYPGTLTAFVGILYTTRHSSGKKLVNIGKIQEFGTKPFAITVTPKMRKFLALVASKTGMPMQTSGKKGKSVYIVQIPARPFLRPSFEYWKKGLQARVLTELKKAGF